MKWQDILFLPYVIIFFLHSDKQALCIVFASLFIQILLSFKYKLDIVRWIIIWLIVADVLLVLSMFFIIKPDYGISMLLFGPVLLLLYSFAILLYLYSFIIKPIFLKLYKSYDNYKKYYYKTTNIIMILGLFILLFLLAILFKNFGLYLIEFFLLILSIPEILYVLLFIILCPIVIYLLIIKPAYLKIINYLNKQK